MRVIFSGVVSIALALSSAFAMQSPAPQQTGRPANAPKLIVVLVLDQFRADYIDLYGRQWTKGLRRLLDRGAVFTQAAYPYATTLTCAGHATIGTGAFPAVHGMSGNDFYDRALRRLVPCAFDPYVTSVPFGGGAGREHHSSRALLVPTFGEELRRQSPGVPTRIVAVAQKPRSAITFAGRGAPDTIAVFEEDDGTWATSDAFTTTPWPEVDEFVRAHPMKAAYGAIWSPILPASAYRFVDAGAGENSPAPWTSTFPHPLISSKGVPDNEFVTAWERSPWDDQFLTDLAIHLLKAKRLGTGAGTDVLTLSLPSLDHNGHEFGPRSHEVQDVLARADANIGRLLDAIDEQVGPRYVVGFSSDHGVAMLPEQVTAEGGDAGRISSGDVQAAVNSAIEKILGLAGRHVVAVYGGDIALTPGLYDLLRQKPGGLQSVTQALAGVRGIRLAYSADDIINGAASSDPGIKAWRLSYVPGRSGDFMMTPKPNWIIRGGTGSTHGTMNTYDQRVPLIFYGAGIRAGRHDVASTPADLAPTLLSLVGAALPRAQGHSLAGLITR
jgi:predicted AlkP superfamily pyrophosphatase or phosphodiesterase